VQQAIADRQKKDAREEEVRVLYVALTRAMDKLYIVGSTSKVDVEKYYDIPALDNFAYMMAPAMFESVRQGTCSVQTIPLKDLELTRLAEEYNEKGCGSLYDIIEPIKDKKKEKRLSSRLDFQYPHQDNSQVKSKYSVTQLNAKEKYRDVTLDTPAFAKEIKGLSAAERGNVMHKVMELIDFSRAVSEGQDYLNEFISGMREQGGFTEEEAKSIWIDDIMAFFNNDIGKRAAASKVLRREQEFVMKMSMDGTDTMVQGIIDCFFEEDGELVLIDYKNSYVGDDTTPEEILERYRNQLELYEEALVKATGMKVKESYLYLFQLKNFIKAK
jgi:ATP-dependent helicase/nuclease subunit A